MRSNLTNVKTVGVTMIICVMDQQGRVRTHPWRFVAGVALSAAAIYAGILWQRGAGLPPLGEGSHLSEEGSHLEEITIATPMLDAIFQNTAGQSEGYAVGVPKGYTWCSGSYKTDSPPPSSFTAVTGKGLVYPKVGARAYSNAGGITIKNAKTYVHLSTTREWVLVQIRPRTRSPGPTMTLASGRYRLFR